MLNFPAQVATPSLFWGGITRRAGGEWLAKTDSVVFGESDALFMPKSSR
jgi:hypothetical protein